MELSTQFRYISMRIVLVILLFSLTGCVVRKYTNRFYWASDSYVLESLEFHTDSSFIWTEESPTHHGKISGNYEIKKRKLILSADTHFRPSILPKLHHTQFTGDTNNLSFSVFLMIDNFKPAIGGSIFIRSETDTAWKKTIACDINGKATVKIHKRYFPLSVKFNYGANKKYGYRIESPVNTSDSIYLSDFWGSQLVFLPSKFPQEYKILKMNSRKLDLLLDSTSNKTDSTVVKRIRLKRYKGLRGM